ncbi:unnamed protein product [Calypogeia fissa]
MAFIFHKTIKLWKLVGGSSYFIDFRSDQAGNSVSGRRLSPKEKGKQQVLDENLSSVPIPSASKTTHGVDVEIINLTRSSAESDQIIFDEDVFPIKEESGPLERPVVNPSVLETRESVYSISALDAFLQILGTSELSKFRRQSNFDWK